MGKYIELCDTCQCNKNNPVACMSCRLGSNYSSYVQVTTLLSDCIDELDQFNMKLEQYEILNKVFGIEKVIFNIPATVVLWSDGTKTIVKSGDYDVYDPEKGLAMAIAKKALGNQGNYYEVFKKWLPEEKEEESVSALAGLKQAFANLAIPALSIRPVVKNVKATNIGEDGLLIEGEITKTGEKFFEKLSPDEEEIKELPESLKKLIDENSIKSEFIHDDDGVKVTITNESCKEATKIQWLSAKEVAEANGLSVECVRKQIKDGLIPLAEKVNGKWKIPCYVFDDHIEVKCV